MKRDPYAQARKLLVENPLTFEPFARVLLDADKKQAEMGVPDQVFDILFTKNDSSFDVENDPRVNGWCVALKVSVVTFVYRLSQWAKKHNRAF
jgi:hypothetical protein